jgi:hypothetical protein
VVPGQVRLGYTLVANSMLSEKSPSEELRHAIASQEIGLFRAFREQVEKNCLMVRKSSKKGWKSVKLTEELSAQADNEQITELMAKGDSLFTEDAKGNMQGVSKKIVREVNLLNKSSSKSASASELALIQKYASRVTIGTPKAQPAHIKRGGLSDPWADAPVKKLKSLVTSSVIRRESFAPSVVPAGAALSVNPSAETLESAIMSAAEQEAKAAAGSTFKVKRPELEVPIPETTPAAESEETTSTGPIDKAPSVRKTKAQKLKEIRHKQMLMEHQIRRREKLARKTLADKSGRLAKEAEQAERREATLKIRAKRVIAEASGKTTLARGAGGRLVNESEILPPTEVASSLRRMIPKGDPVLERRASLLKRRMIEQVPEMNKEYKEKIRFAGLDSKKAAKMVDRDARNRCVMLG